MKYTANLNLKKPEGTDVVNINDLNDNADIIDSELKRLDTKKVDKVEFDEHLADFTRLKNKLPIATGEYIATKDDTRIINIGFIPALLIIDQYVGSRYSRQHIGHFWYTSDNVYYYEGMTHIRDGTSNIHNTSDVASGLLGRIEDGKIGFSFIFTGEGDRITYFAFGDAREVIK